RRWSGSWPTTSRAPPCAPPQSPRWPAPMLGRDSRGRPEQSPKKLVMQPPGIHRPAGRKSDRNLNHKAQAPLPDGLETKPNYRQTLNCARGIGEPKRVQRDHCADGSVTATPDPDDAPHLVRPGFRDRATAHRKPERTPTENRAAPTVLVRGRAFVPFQ